MEINKENIDKLVKYINIELKKNSKATVNKLCDKMGVKQSTFKTWVHKAGYKFNVDTRQYTKVSQEDISKEITVQKNNIQECYKDININELKELLSLKDDLKELIQQYHKSKNIIDVEAIELKVKAVTEVKQRLFKIDVEVLEQWDKFIAEHKEFKVQQLTSLALKEFIDKYSN